MRYHMKFYLPNEAAKKKRVSSVLRWKKMVLVAEMGEEWSGKIWGVQQINIKMMDLFED